MTHRDVGSARFQPNRGSVASKAAREMSQMATPKQQDTGRRTGGSDMQETRRRCQTWLPRKGRFCSAAALPLASYCGNHKPPDVETRVPCPIDPSHDVLESEIPAHSRKCPSFLRRNALERMPYYHGGMNAGSEEDDDGDADENIRMREQEEIKQVSKENPQSGVGEFHDSCTQGQGVDVGTIYAPHKGFWASSLKRSCFNSLPKGQLEKLLFKIESAYHKHCKGSFDFSIEEPSACSKWVGTRAEPDRCVPFQEKHVRQQASMLGNMEKFGLLQSNDIVQKEGIPHSNKECVFIEFGAGRGYLAHMLADCYGAKRIIFIERRSYKFKADRNLRQNANVSFERIQIDIENLNLAGIKSLEDHHYIALSKHLCGYASDLALRCCLESRKHLLLQNSAPLLDGIAIATCCHHLCQWKPYVNKGFFRKMGFTKQEFNLLTWLTSGALSYDHNFVLNEQTLSEPEAPPLDLISATETRNFQAGLEDVNEFLSQPKNRVALGFKCKKLLDIGRLHWIWQHGMTAKFVSYVPSTITPENKLLLAKWSDG